MLITIDAAVGPMQLILRYCSDKGNDSAACIMPLYLTRVTEIEVETVLYHVSLSTVLPIMMTSTRKRWMDKICLLLLATGHALKGHMLYCRLECPEYRIRGRSM